MKFLQEGNKPLLSLNNKLFYMPIKSNQLYNEKNRPDSDRS